MFGRPNKIVPNYTNFDISPFKQVFDHTRMHAVGISDAIKNPYQTVDPWVDPLIYKDPGYIELGKRDTYKQDLKSKAIRDHSGSPIYKIDRSHGLLNGGLICQATHGRNQSNLKISKRNPGIRSQSISLAGAQMMSSSKFDSTLHEVEK